MKNFGRRVRLTAKWITRLFALVIIVFLFAFLISLGINKPYKSPTTTAVSVPKTLPAPVRTKPTVVSVLCVVNGYPVHTDLVHAKKIGCEFCKLPECVKDSEGK